MPRVCWKRGGVPVRSRDVGVQVAGKIFAPSRLAGTPVRVSLNAIRRWRSSCAARTWSCARAITLKSAIGTRRSSTVPPDAMIADLVEDSYDLVVRKLPRARRLALASRGDAWLDRSVHPPTQRRRWPPIPVCSREPPDRRARVRRYGTRPVPRLNYMPRTRSSRVWWLLRDRRARRAGQARARATPVRRASRARSAGRAPASLDDGTSCSSQP